MIRRWLSTAVKIALTVGLLWYLSHKVNLAEAWQAGKTLSITALVAALLLQIVQTFLCGLRWQMVLRAIEARITLLRASVIFTIGNFFGQVLPGAIGGDVVRMWLTVKSGVAVTPAVNSVLLERMATVFGLVALVAAGEPLLAAHLPDSRGLWLFPVLAVGLAAGTGVVMLLDRLPRRLTEFRLIRAFAKLAADCRLLVLRPREAFPVLAVVVIGHINLGLIVYVLARGLGVEIGVADCVLLTLPAVLVATLPISIAGWGARELALMTLFGFAGVPAAQALAMSVLFGLVGLVVTLPGGVLWLFQRERKVAAVGG